MTPVEVCGICDIAGCHHIRERKAAAGLSGTLPDATSALDALVRDAVFAADCLQETGTFETGQGILHDCARAITTLRAQLAEAHKDGFQLAAWQCLFDDGKTGIVCDDWGNQYCAMQRRAEQAEAALAAQIEVDAEIANDHTPEKHSGMTLQAHVTGRNIAAAIRAQPHDRTALDRHDAKTREKALREAAQRIALHLEVMDALGERWPMRTCDKVESILALIEKPNAR